MINTDPTKKRWWTQVFVKGKQFLSLLRHTSCYSYNQEVFDTTMRKQTQVRHEFQTSCYTFMSVSCHFPSILPVILSCLSVVIFLRDFPLYFHASQLSFSFETSGYTFSCHFPSRLPVMLSCLSVVIFLFVNIDYILNISVV
jgi:hypothetical protein